MQDKGGSSRRKQEEPGTCERREGRKMGWEGSQMTVQR